MPAFFSTIIAIVIDGLVFASWIFIVAVGLSLIFGVMRILNVAHGSLYAFGAYVAASMVGWYFNADLPALGSLAVLLASAFIVGIPLGFLMERGLLRFMYGRDEVIMVLVTYATFLMLEDAIMLIWGTDAYFAFEPYAMLGNTEIENLVFSNYDLFLIGLAVGVAVLLWWGLNRTRIGKLLQAVIHDRELAQAFGINVTRVFTLTFILGAILGALGGAFTAPQISVTPGIGVEVIILAFAVVAIGGMGSIPGALVGAILVGIFRAAAVHLFPQVEIFIIYAVMAFVLTIRPQGLFGQVVARRI